MIWGVAPATKMRISRYFFVSMASLYCFRLACSTNTTFPQGFKKTRSKVKGARFIVHPQDFIFSQAKARPFPHVDKFAKGKVGTARIQGAIKSNPPAECAGLHSGILPARISFPV